MTDRTHLRVYSAGALIVALTLLLGGCGSAPKQESASRAPSTPPARGGGFYLDDGPGPNPPPNIEAIPDAVPRVEPLHRGALRRTP